MMVEKWSGLHGGIYQDISDSNWQSLKDLSEIYRKEGKRCWLCPPKLSTPQDYARKDYLLIVKTKEESVFDYIFGGKI